jgi:hypothetical protein
LEEINRKLLPRKKERNRTLFIDTIALLELRSGRETVYQKHYPMAIGGNQVDGLHLWSLFLFLLTIYIWSCCHYKKKKKKGFSIV